MAAGKGGDGWVGAREGRGRGQGRAAGWAGRAGAAAGGPATAAGAAVQRSTARRSAAQQAQRSAAPAPTLAVEARVGAPVHALHARVLDHARDLGGGGGGRGVVIRLQGRRACGDGREEARRGRGRSAGWAHAAGRAVTGGARLRVVVHERLGQGLGVVVVGGGLGGQLRAGGRVLPLCKMDGGTAGCGAAGRGWRAGASHVAGRPAGIGAPRPNRLPRKEGGGGLPRGQLAPARHSSQRCQGAAASPALEQTLGRRSTHSCPCRRWWARS